MLVLAIIAAIAAVVSALCDAAPHARSAWALVVSIAHRAVAGVNVRRRALTYRGRHRR